MNPSGDPVALETITIPILAVEQPIGQFYVGTIPAADLQTIAYADTRRQTQVEKDAFVGIQRELNEKRKQEIKKYISSFGASFPNSFIIAIHSDDVLKEEAGSLTIKKNSKVACIIDGQHRLSGFDQSNAKDFDLVVSIFIDIPLESQAMLFATINLKQTRVNESLVYDLFEETTTRSPQKSAHDVAKSMNRDSDSPFYHQIKPLGRRTNEYEGRISQATFIKRLLPLICKNPDDIRDALKRAQKLNPEDPQNQKCPFWKFFVDAKDWAIKKAITNYFAAVAQTFPGDWGSDTSALGKTIGFGAFMRLLGPLASHGIQHKRLNAEFFATELKKAATLAPFTLQEYPASGAGENKLARALEEKILPTVET